MSEFYLGMQASASRVLADRGRAMILRKLTPGTYSPTSGAVTQTATDYPASGAQFPYPALLIDGTRIQRGDMKVLLSAEGLAMEPDTGDQLLIGGQVWAIVSAQAIGPDGTVVVWKLQVRR